MSITISNCQQICSSPTNHSKSKMLYSFSKADRFKKTKDNPCHNFYQIGGRTKMNRTTNFGYDQKYDFTKDMPNTPPPNSYNLSSDFQDGKTKKRGFCFGGGRDDMIVTGPLCQMRNNKNPGPGSYNIPSSKMVTSYSLRAKFDYQNKQPYKVPGPGTYSINSPFSKDGKNTLSKHKNISGVLFCKSVDRFNYPVNKAPGPGSYSTSQVSMSGTGKYFYSKIHNSRARKFNMANRQTLSAKSITPGPGSYKLPSQFGYYASKDFASSIQSSRYKKSRVISEQNKENAIN